MGSVEVYSPVYTGPKINLPGWLLAVIIVICLLVVFGILVIIFPPVWVVIKVVFKVLYYIVKYLLISLVWKPYLILVLPIQAIVQKSKHENVKAWNPLKKK